MLSGLAAAGLLPRWVFWVGAARYGILVVGGAWLYIVIGPVRIHSTSFGRATGVIMTSLIALYTLLWALRSDVAMGLTRLTEIALGSLLIATTIQIVLVGWYNLRVMTGALNVARFGQRLFNPCHHIANGVAGRLCRASEFPIQPALDCLLQVVARVDNRRGCIGNR